MAKKSKKTNKKKKRPVSQPAKLPSLPPEERGAEAATVAWMLSLLATMAAIMLSAALRAIPGMIWGADALSAEVRMLPGLLVIVSVITGTLCLILTPLVHRFRKVAPPRQITFAAIVAGVVPWVVLIGMYIRAN